jgi:hypothetical protein
MKLGGFAASILVSRLLPDTAVVRAAGRAGDHIVRGACVALSVVFAVACAKTSHTAAAAPSSWPSYSASDYRKGGQPTLSNLQTTLIRKTLAMIGP